MSTTRIARNTLALYFRQILIMLVSLYTVRVVLATLGAEDYGIYNVVAGVVTMFGFLSGAMATASQRYFAFEIGRGDFERLRCVFSLTLLIYLLLAALALLLAETVGLWFVRGALALPPGRRAAAQWVYQASVASFLCAMITTPYMAAIIAREEMNIYAYVSIAEAALKLGAVFLLRVTAFDKLPFYAALMCAVAVIVTAAYRLICVRKFPECRFVFYWNTGLFKEMAGFTGWSVFGSLTTVARNQAVTILLNQFFNPVVAAARSIASQVNSAVSTFSANFNTALQPQIIKTWSAGRREEMPALLSRGAKGTYFLMYVFSLPLALEMPQALSLWLKNLPEHTVVFTRLTIIDVLINSVSYPVMTAARAVGKMRIYESVLGGIQLAGFFVTWLVLRSGGPAWSAMAVSIGISALMFFARLLIVRYLAGLPLRQFFRAAIVPLGIVTVVSAVAPVTLFLLLEQSLARLCVVVMASVASTCAGMYLLGLNKAERGRVKEFVARRIRKHNHA